MDEEYPLVVCFVEMLSDCWGLSWPGMSVETLLTGGTSIAKVFCVLMQTA